MNTRTLILIIVLGVITIGLVTLAIMSQTSKESATTINDQQPTMSEEDKIKRSTTLYFEEVNTTRSSIGTQSATTTLPLRLMIDSGENEVFGAQVELSYDPQVLSNVKLTPPTDQNESFFGSSSEYIVLDNTIKQSEGRISYIIAIVAAPGSKSKTGVGSIGTLTFNKSGSQPTTITFLDKTKVEENTFGLSVLKEARSITIQ